MKYINARGAQDPFGIQPAPEITPVPTSKNPKDYRPK